MTDEPSLPKGWDPAKSQSNPIDWLFFSLIRGTNSVNPA